MPFKGRYNRGKGKGRGRRTKGSQTAKNTRAIRLLKDTQFRRCTYVGSFHLGPFDGDIPSAGNVPPIQSGTLISPSDWSPVWGSQPNPDPAAVVQKTYHPTCFLVDNVQLRLNLRLGGPNIGNGEEPIHYAFFAFKIRKGMREQTKYRLLNQSPPGAAAFTFLEGLDYTSTRQGASFPNSESMWELNPDIYDIKATRRGRIGVWPAPFPLGARPNPTNYIFTTSANMDDCNKDYKINIPFKKKLEYGVGYVQPDPNDPSQMPIRTSWKTLDQTTVDDGDQIWWLLFHDSMYPEHSPLSVSMSLQVRGREPQ